MKPQRFVTSSLASATFAVLAIAPSFGATTIGTTAKTSIGFGNYDSVGQTFTAPTDNVLNSFSALFSPGQDPLTLALYAWNGSTITGSALYTSGPVNGSTVGNIDTFSFTGINQLLTTGGNYAALFHDTSKGYGVYADYSATVDPYTGGQFVAGYNGNQTFQILDDSFSPHYDMAFTAQFSGGASVPEPGAPVTLGVFVLGIAGFAFRARKTKVRPA